MTEKDKYRQIEKNKYWSADCKYSNIPWFVDLKIQLTKGKTSCIRLVSFLKKVSGDRKLIFSFNDLTGWNKTSQDLKKSDNVNTQTGF